MLRLGNYQRVGTAYLNDKYKKFRDKTGKIYKGNKVVLLVLDKEENIYVTLDSYNKHQNKSRENMTVVEEITSWSKKVDNLKISTRSGMYKRTWKSRKKNGTRHSTTGKNHGTAQEEKGRPGVRFVKE